MIARQLNKVCIVGCRDLVIGRRGDCRIGEVPLREGDWLSLDGHAGRVYAGRLPVVTERPVKYLEQVERWKEAHAKGGGPRSTDPDVSVAK